MHGLSAVVSRAVAPFRDLTHLRTANQTHDQVVAAMWPPPDLSLSPSLSLSHTRGASSFLFTFQIPAPQKPTMSNKEVLMELKKPNRVCPRAHSGEPTDRSEYEQDEQGKPRPPVEATDWSSFLTLPACGRLGPGM